MKVLALITLALPLLAEETKPSDAAVAAYFKADANLAAVTANQDKLLENIKSALAQSVEARLKAAMAVTAAFSELQAQCGGAVDTEALQKTGDVKCGVKPEKK